MVTEPQSGDGTIGKVSPNFTSPEGAQYFTNAVAASFSLRCDILFHTIHAG